MKKLITPCIAYGRAKPAHRQSERSAFFQATVHTDWYVVLNRRLMKGYLTILCLMFWVTGFSSSESALDTISYWKVYNGGELIGEFNGYSANSKIILTKGKVRAIDTLNIAYFDDTPCFECSASIVIRSKNGNVIRSIENTRSNYSFDLKTTELQILAQKNRSTIMVFYYKEDENQKELELFEIEIK